MTREHPGEPNGEHNGHAPRTTPASRASHSAPASATGGSAASGDSSTFAPGASLRGWIARGRDLAGDWMRGGQPGDAVLVPTSQATASAPVRLGDFTADWRMVLMSALAIGIGILGAFIAVALMGLIGFITNLAYFHVLSFKLVSPTNTPFPWWETVPIPIIGGLIIGFMARYGSERIRGHGIPEAMETILVGGSRIEPRLLLLKPTSSALSIGTGGPFGAEGPIILTGGALGSVIGQFFKLTAAERKTLLVAGAAAGMAATFNAPVASVLLAVELLLFEWKPRSLVPVALASAAATLLRRHLIAAGPMFPLGAHPTLDWDGIIASVFVGLAAGILAWVLTIGVYGAEDAFRKLPIHWMWWPAIGGIAVGVGGAFFPRALGVGYDTIGDELAGHLAISILVGVIVVKALIWCIALGSGTSGGILAPLLLIGGALGGIEAHILPTHSAGLWALISMAAALAGVTRSPLTGVIFALELTAAVNVMLPLLVACTVAHMVTVLVLKRSILTEKVARRGFHVTREYSVDPLEVLSVREVMQGTVVTLAADLPISGLRRQLAQNTARAQRLYPVVDADGEMVGVFTRTDLARLNQHTSDNQHPSDNQPASDDDGERAADTRTVADVMREEVAVAYPDETLRMVAARMITRGAYRLPVVKRADPRQIVGLISQRELLRARERLLEEERHRERVLRLRIVAPRAGRTQARRLTSASGPEITAVQTGTGRMPPTEIVESESTVEAAATVEATPTHGATADKTPVARKRNTTTAEVPAEPGAMARTDSGPEAERARK